MLARVGSPPNYDFRRRSRSELRGVDHFPFGIGTFSTAIFEQVPIWNGMVPKSRKGQIGPTQRASKKC
jgi:hypothetical protein